VPVPSLSRRVIEKQEALIYNQYTSSEKKMVLLLHAIYCTTKLIIVTRISGSSPYIFRIFRVDQPPGWLSAVMNLDMDHHFAKAGVELPTPAGAIAAAAGSRRRPLICLPRTRTPSHVFEDRIQSFLFFILFYPFAIIKMFKHFKSKPFLYFPTGLPPLSITRTEITGLVQP
jgi:hypothetical protein